MRQFAVSIALLVLSGSLVIPPAASVGEALEVDAGTSRILGASPVSVSAQALGGVAPYLFSWSLEGSATRFADPNAASTTFDPAGLSPGDIVLTVTATDSESATAVDTVRHHIGHASFSATFGGSTLGGGPDEELALTLDMRPHTFTVPAGTPRFTAVLDWDSDLDDLELELVGPGGYRSGAIGQTGNKPEIIVIEGPTSGGWQARVSHYLSGPETYSLTISGPPAFSLVRAFSGTSYTYGANDTHRLLAGAADGVAPYSFAWDLDGDGRFETHGDTPVAAFAPGVHDVRLRVSDAAGFEVDDIARVTVLSVANTLHARCNPDAHNPFGAMEFSASRGTCWMHGGHQTYFFGPAAYTLLGATGRLFSVEQQFSPPTRMTPSGAAIVSPIHVQSSLNGTTWREIHLVNYTMVRDPVADGLGAPQRQLISFEIASDSVPFRFLRVHQPLSAAQGLSGYLDYTEILVRAQPVVTVAAAPLKQQTRAFECQRGDHMEDFFVEHPCWFGGIDRYDAASFFHTYPVGNGSITSITGEFVLLPWRSDDWKQSVPLGPAWTKTHAFVQVSADGQTWTDVATVDAEYGFAQTFVVAFPEPVDARFVRLLPAYHARFDQHGAFAPNHHPEGYFQDSRVAVSGMLSTL